MRYTLNDPQSPLHGRVYTITGETADGLVTATFKDDRGRDRVLRSHERLRALTLVHKGDSVPHLTTTRGRVRAAQMMPVIDEVAHA